MDFVPAQQSTEIVLPVWRLVHRFIDTCAILRRDEGRWISKTNLEMMCCFHEHVRFDPLILIRKSVEEATIRTFRGTHLGGGPFVTMIANDISFSLGPHFAMPINILGEEEMI